MSFCCNLGYSMSFVCKLGYSVIQNVVTVKYKKQVIMNIFDNKDSLLLVLPSSTSLKKEILCVVTVYYVWLSLLIQLVLIIC